MAKQGAFVPSPLGPMCLPANAKVSQIIQFVQECGPFIRKFYCCKSFKVRGLLATGGPCFFHGNNSQGSLLDADPEAQLWQVGITLGMVQNLVLAVIEPDATAVDLTTPPGLPIGEEFARPSEFSTAAGGPANQTATVGAAKDKTKKVEKTVPALPDKVSIPPAVNQVQPLLMKAMSRVASEDREGLFHYVVKGEHGWHHLVFWKRHAAILKSTDKQAVSKECFRLPIGDVQLEGDPGCPFVFMIHPKLAYLSKGGSCFKKAKGNCTVEVKCNAEPAKTKTVKEDWVLQYSLAVGGVTPEKMQTEPRGPYTNNFYDKTTTSSQQEVPKAEELWNLNAAVDDKAKDGNKFIIGLQVHNMKSKGDAEELDLEA